MRAMHACSTLAHAFSTWYDATFVKGGSLVKAHELFEKITRRLAGESLSGVFQV